MQSRKLGAVLGVLLLTVPPMSAQDDPHDVVCATNAVEDAVGEARYFCEPMQSTAFIQFDQFVEGIHYLESTYPDYIHVKQIGESVGGLPIYFVEVTNEQSDVPREQKLQLGYSASIHANEAAGREGMLRMIEDLVAGVGPHGAELKPLLDHQIVNVWFPNPDSWATGDFFAAEDVASRHECDRPNDVFGITPSTGVCAGYDRHNFFGVDLNREFPSPGIIHDDHTPVSEPESQAVVKELRFSGDHSNLVAGVDLHGMVGSPNMIRSIIPNQDYDFRRMVLAVDMLRTTEDRVNTDPAFDDWNRGVTVDDLAEEASDTVGEECVETIQGDACTPGDDVGLRTGYVDADVEKPMEWGARWDMIGYTDTGFTSDYLMLSPRSPTGGMGAVGTITEFAYSHFIPDNKYVAKLTDMHVAGVRQIVRTQMEMVGRLETPMLAGTGDVGYAWVDDAVTSDDDPRPYEAGQAFDIDDESTWFDFDQVPYDVTNLRFWEDLDRFSVDPITPVDAEGFEPSDLEGLRSFVITNQALDGFTDDDIAALREWVEGGGHLLLTDSALQWFDRAGLTTDAAGMVKVYLGHSDVQDWEHPLMDDVTWDARVTGEGPAIGIQVGTNYPQWTLDIDDLEALDADIVGTTGEDASLGRVPVGDGTVDFIGAALPRPVQDHAECSQCTSADHRYGLADYSVSAFTYWLVMNSLDGHIEWQSIEEPFIPTYDFDPLYGDSVASMVDSPGEENSTPAAPVAFVAIAVLAVAVVARRRQ